MAKFTPQFCLVLLLVTLLVSMYQVMAEVLNDRPIIGIVMHPESIASPAYPNRQYVAASYVKWIESSGGRVVLLPHTLSPTQFKKSLRQLNGLLFTGGGFIYPDIITDVLDEVIAMNQEGIHFPVWGTCLGFQWLGIYFSKNRDLLGKYPAPDEPMHLDFAPTANTTSLYNSMPNSLRDIFADPTLKVTMNNHNYGIGFDDFNTQLSQHFNLISTNVDDNNSVFISTMQHKKFPIIGVQWHPEKNNFEFGVQDGSPYSTTKHSLESVIASQFTSNFFVHECRKNSNKFADWKEEQARLTYSQPKFRGNTGSFVEKYWVDGATGVY